MPEGGTDQRQSSNSSDDRWKKWDTRLRDSILFIVGIAGIINELFYVASPRPQALVFLASIVGLPFVFAAEEQRRKGRD